MTKEEQEKKELEKRKKKARTCCCKLLAKYPLYDSLPQEQDPGSLKVLLVGSGEFLEVVRDEILANGQLLDKQKKNIELEVHILTNDIREDADNLKKYAPELGRFVHIYGVYGMLPVEWNIGTRLHYHPSALYPSHMPVLFPECNYVVISTGDDIRNEELAKAFAGREMVARVSGETIVVGDKVDVFTSNLKDGYPKNIDKIARNAQYVYSKENNPWATRAAIAEKVDDEYCDPSNREYALHVGSKLYCCGIKMDDPQAAEKFHHAMQVDENLEDKLAELEHRRWCISKLLQGYHKLDLDDPADRKLLYGKPGVTNLDKEAFWHTCLLSFGELPAMQRKIRARCEELMEDHKDDLDVAWETLQRTAVKELTDKKKAAEWLDEIDLACKLLRMNNFSAVGLFDRVMKNMEDKATKDGDLAKALKEMRHQMGPRIEYVSRKDYKEINRVFVRQIPFLLTRREKPVVMKLMAAKAADNVFSAWQKEPGQILFVTLLENQRELKRAGVLAHQIEEFFGENKDTERSYHVLATASSGLKAREIQDVFDGVSVNIHGVKNRAREHLKDALGKLAADHSVKYIDLTGCEPALACVAEEIAREESLGAFYCCDGEFRNFCNAVEMEYQGPRKGLTIQEMFKQSSGIHKKSDGVKLVDLVELYRPLWEVARKYRKDWYAFCEYVKKEYRVSGNKSSVGKTAILPKKDGSPKSCGILRAMNPKLKPLLMEMLVQGYLEDVVFDPLNNDAELHFCGDIDQLVQQLEKVNTNETDCYCMKWDGAQPDVERRTMEISPTFFSHATPEFKNIANALVQKGVLDSAWRAPDSEILLALRNSGKVLEYYLYYTALMGCEFTDVDMSWQFAHGNWEEKKAENEIDVICTWGTHSMFISAKNVGQSMIGNTDTLNDYCYQILLLADRFGVNPYVVLAAPNVEMNDKKGAGIVKHAWSRGVYLLGDWCFENNRLPEILTHISKGEEDWCAYLKKKGAII